MSDPYQSPAEDEGTELEQAQVDSIGFQTFLLGQGLTYAFNERTATIAASSGRFTQHGHRIFDYRGHPVSHHVGRDDNVANNPANESINDIGFIDLPDECRRLLVPMAKVYKTFLDVETGERVDLRIETDYHNNGVNRVELEKIDFTRLGGNPAEVDSNINFNISLSARELGFYLKRQYPLSEQGGTDLRTKRLESRGVAWIDLIKIDPGRSLDVDTGRQADEQVVNQSDARIRVELGYQIPVDSQKPATMSQDDWIFWKDVISKQKEEFYLSLFKHNFDFKSSGEVGLSIDFKASASAKLLDPKSDILIDPKMSEEIKQKSEQLRILRRRLRNVDEEQESCVDSLNTSVEELSSEIEKLQNHMKNRLLSQLYLGALFSRGTPGRKQKGTRIFQCRFMQEGSIDSTVNRDEQFQFSIYDDRGDRSTGENIHDDLISDFNINEEGGDNEKKNIEQLVFLGDIVQAAREIVAENYEFGGSAATRWSGNQGTSFSLIPLMNEVDNRVAQMYRELGAIRLGKVKWTSPANPNITKQHALATLPISLNLFRAWFKNKVSSRRSLPLRDFIQSLFSDFLTREVFLKLKYEIDDPEKEPLIPEFSLISIQPDEAYRQQYDRRFTIALTAEQAEGTAERAYPSSILLIQQNRPPNADELAELPQLLWGQSTRGIMESVKFERADIPGYAEARLFSDRQSTSNNLAIREKYNATISMVGNTVFLPGSQLNLLPEPLDLGFAEEEGSIARSLGLGGVFVVHRIENQIDMVRGSWDTQLITKWESSGEEAQTDEATDVEQYCADLAAAAAAEAAAAAAEFVETYSDAGNVVLGVGTQGRRQ